MPYTQLVTHGAAMVRPAFNRVWIGHLKRSYDENALFELRATDISDENSFQSLTKNQF